LLTLANKLKNNAKFIDEISKLTSGTYAKTVDGIIGKIDELYKQVPENAIKNLDDVIDDFDYLVTNHLDDLIDAVDEKNNFQRFMAEFLGGKDKFKAAATSLEVIKNISKYLPNKFKLEKLELENLISANPVADGQFRFDILWNANDNGTGRVLRIFIDTKNYSVASNMFKDLGQFKAYLNQISNFDEMYYIQQAGRGIQPEDIIKQLQKVILDKSNNGKNLEDIFEVIWNNTSLKQNLQKNIFKGINDAETAFELFSKSIENKSSDIFNSILITK